MPNREQLRSIFDNGESIEFAGKAVVALAGDARVLQKSGRVIIAADAAGEYGFSDIDGRNPPSMRSLSYLLRYSGWKTTAGYIPQWMRLPGWLMSAATGHL